MAVAGQSAAAKAGRVELSIVADNAGPEGERALRQQEPLLAIPTRYGIVGVLHERGVVLAVRPGAAGEGADILYRRHTGAELSLTIAGEAALAVDDLIMVKSLTLPDGTVTPIALRPYSGQEWTVVGDVDAVLRLLGMDMRTVAKGVGVGVGTLATAAIFSSFALPICAFGAALSLGVAWQSRRAAERDTRAVERLLARR
ncbi:MAG: hypothetical protein QM690_08325 [Sphingobium sp.]